MIKHFCDRCGNEAAYIEQEKGVLTIESPKLTLIRKPRRNDFIEIELCADCMAFFEEEMKKKDYDNA